MDDHERSRLIVEIQALRDRLVRQGQEFQTLEREVARRDAEQRAETSRWRQRYEAVVESRTYRLALLLRQGGRALRDPLRRR
jgi:hypothetical protein